jgi:hypothetical protein
MQPGINVATLTGEIARDAGLTAPLFLVSVSGALSVVCHSDATAVHRLPPRTSVLCVGRLAVLEHRLTLCTALVQQARGWPALPQRNEVLVEVTFMADQCIGNSNAILPQPRRECTPWAAEATSIPPASSAPRTAR